jgi:hypothetical protein
MSKYEKAEEILWRAAKISLETKPSAEWLAKVEKLSVLSTAAGIKTHIAFLGASMLAKATWLDADLFAIKPTHQKDEKGAYSARTLCHKVLVPLSGKIGINIGPTGREPLNNQPYFRMVTLGDGTPVHKRSKSAFDYMVSLVTELSSLKTEAEAIDALAAFIAVRRNYLIKYTPKSGSIQATLEQFPALVSAFVLGKSEGGRRAQAVAAGILDVFAEERVISGRINDPDRNAPGDVCIVSIEDPELIEKAFEVRDKPVSESDVQIFVNKCLEARVTEPALILVAASQSILDPSQTVEWAQGLGITVTIFYGWKGFIEEAFFWAGPNSAEAMYAAIEKIGERLQTVEASEETFTTWIGTFFK